ncbi:MAG: hypothetical protein A2W61_07140 [Deltaproteobacteria bacterium RIFCSPLOWO2_01_44_7]|nr:MAG: hypothetical protein A2712_08195 [Deltaproteobacteria bacterium RIFCSPHIGHO2_01_FULL_43_49]OGQ14682.1 MAG: hypothetical protein A3D22_08805 [Deltaproteobacteria bacterium RIFCSPHIGHO2_02_FULL_44_53]OGQ28068.1 MAG: hypothetical protein A3D98_07515 [Deltaproteobacteria bacterium RIFCSPHIGHO2_12_FULL_44_21]OGQ31280.1 MAG: hypothetical protein A2979_07565 [Deltaproteobacteria bacterium RIFCSPLOWO2_01_FULL_45_74]OGQ41517.1 MAG: hypothetical protein A2W61_07140 [Deltaproteobacteria bacterium 
MTTINFGFIEAAITAAQAAQAASNRAELDAALEKLGRAIHPLDTFADGNLSPLVERLTSGRRAVTEAELNQVIRTINDAGDKYRASSGTKESKASSAHTGHGVHGSPNPYLIQVGQSKTFSPRPNQAYIARKAVSHFREEHRGFFRLDTGEGKTPTYGFIIQELRKELPDEYQEALVVMGCHQAEPARKLAETMKHMFRDEKIMFLEGGIEAEDFKRVTFVVGTYQQLAQKSSIDVLKEWAGQKRILFVLDEADMVVFKGIAEDEHRMATWIRLLIDFGVFTQHGHYLARTRHRLLGASATLDRPDEISLSTVWGPGNVFYHTPMAEGVRRGTLVPVVGHVLEMDVPEKEKHLFRDFTKIVDGKIVVDKTKVMSACGSDHAVKTSVRAVIDHMKMKIGAGTTKGEAVRRGIGYAMDTTALEKHMRWQQELFGLVEVIFQIYQGLAASKPMHVDTILAHLGGLEKLDAFGQTLKRFLYAREWKTVESLYRKAVSSLKNGRKEGISELFTTLYSILNVDVRRIKGRPLVATAVWQSMDMDREGKKIPREARRTQYLNKFGDRELTMKGFNAGVIDMLWSIGMLDRGFDEPMASLIVDNAPSSSRREVVQRAGRIMRPPDPKNPKDHSQKPESIYITLTPNLEAHHLDVARKDLARVFGTEVDPELNIIKIRPTKEGDFEWRTPDPVQLDLGGDKKVHLVLVGARTVEALVHFLKGRYGKDYDPEILAFDAGVGVEEVDDLLRAIRFPKESRLRAFLKNWRADDATIHQIMAIYHSDLADMKTVYGNAWRIVQ